MKKLYLLFFIILIFAALFTFVILRTDYIANAESVMILRNWYQNTYINVVSGLRDERATIPKYKLPYALQVQPWMDRYVYTLYGKIVDVNKDKKEILILGDDGAEYVIKPSKWLMRDLGWDFESETVVFDQDYVQLDSVPMNNGDRIRLMWDDNRKLSEIKNTHRVSPKTVVNSGIARFFYFTHQNK